MLESGPLNLISHVHEIVRPFWGIPGFLCSRQESVLQQLSVCCSILATHKMRRQSFVKCSAVGTGADFLSIYRDLSVNEFS